MVNQENDIATVLSNYQEGEAARDFSEYFL